MRPRLACTLATLAVALCMPSAAHAAALDGDGMWIWQKGRSTGGSVTRIVAKAKRHGVETVIVKAAHGRRPWRQFSRPLVTRLHRSGLKVCAYQRIIGLRPRAEAGTAARAKRLGADCLVVDAESEYEGRYAGAQVYIRRLRARVGPTYEVALTSFPYVHYHPRFPYSVFLGPGGAQANIPQMYWKDIGVSVDRIFKVTWTHNKVYGRPIYPLGQTYLNPSPRQIKRFRQLALVYGAGGVSWWAWEHSRGRHWRALGAPLSLAALPRRRDRWPMLRRGSRSDLVAWAQQHLMRLGLLRVVNGRFGSGTRRAVRTFQTRNGLVPSGRVDAVTWPRLLAAGPAAVRWRGRSARPLVPRR